MNIRRRMVQGLLGAVVSATLAGAVAPGLALAAGNRTVYVDDTGTANATKSGSCGRPNYLTIQAAVNDGTVSKVIVCEGTYSEQVAVNRSLTLEGRSGAVIQAPAAVNATSSAIVLFTGVQTSRLRGFTITGTATTANFNAAIDVRDGAQVTISRNHIRDLRDNDPAYNAGTGIYVSGGHADISDNEIERYEHEGITVFGPDSFAAIDGNHIHTPIGQSQIGIDIREGGKGDVEDNMITGNGSEGSAGIIVDQTDHVSLRDNTVTNHYRGIVLGDETGGVEVRSNVVRNNTSHGISLNDAVGNTIVENESDHNGGHGILVVTSPSEPNAFLNVIRTNKVHDNTGDGIHLGLNVLDTTVKENKVFNNHGTDIVDENGGLPANMYQDNHCGTSTPAGLCNS